MTITESTTVAAIASSFPSSVRVFQRHGIDFCCGGKTSLAVACQEQGVPVADLVLAIEASSRQAEPDDRDWNAEPLHVLINYIIATYHLPLRHELPRLESMAAKVSRVHGAKAAHLTRLEAIVSELSADLQSHMLKEERVLFPAIRAVERGQEQLSIPLFAPIGVMAATRPLNFRADEVRDSFKETRCRLSCTQARQTAGADLQVGEGRFGSGLRRRASRLSRRLRRPASRAGAAECTRWRAPPHPAAL